MTGYYFVFKIQQREIRKEFKRLLQTGIAEDKLVVIEFDKNHLPAKGEEIKFIGNHELFCHNTFYDIVRLETLGSVTKYYCIADQHETLLFARFSKVMKEETNKNNDQKNHKSSFKQFFNPFTFSTNQPFFDIFASGFSSKINYQFSLKLWNSFPLVPPPKF
jgi:hypothetical protein